MNPNDIQLTQVEYDILSYLQVHPFAMVTEIADHVCYAENSISRNLRSIANKYNVHKSSTLLSALGGVGWIVPKPVDYDYWGIPAHCQPILNHWERHPFDGMVLTANALPLKKSTLHGYIKRIYRTLNISGERPTMRLRLYANLGWYIPKPIKKPVLQY
jgi:hypothetical protein